jgi:hypothetical protein
MRKSLWIILAAVFMAICAPYAHADSTIDGTLNFTVSSGSPTPSGSFVFDNTTSTFTSFTVDWDGAVFNFAAEGITLGELANGNWCGQGPANTTSPCAPEIFSLSGSAFLGSIFTPAEGGTFTDPSAFAAGTYTVTETVVGAPEPSSVALMLAGIGFSVRDAETHRSAPSTG